MDSRASPLIYKDALQDRQLTVKDADAQSIIETCPASISFLRINRV